MATWRPGSRHNTTLEGNEIAYNGAEQRCGKSANVTFRNNFVHHNVGAGIWYDSDNTGALIEGNRVEDNGRKASDYEISIDGIIRNNTIRRSGETGVFISMSKNMQIYNNTLDTISGGSPTSSTARRCAGRPTLISRTMRRMTTRSSSARRAGRSRASSANRSTAHRHRWRRI